MNRQNPEEFNNTETPLWDTVMEDTCHYTFVETHRCTRMNCNINHRLGVIKICHCSFTSLTNEPLWWGMLIVVEAMNAWGQGLYVKSLYFLLSLTVNLKLNKKESVFSKNPEFFILLFDNLLSDNWSYVLNMKSSGADWY